MKSQFPIMYKSYYINNYATKLKEVVCIIMVHYTMMNHRNLEVCLGAVSACPKIQIAPESRMGEIGNQASPAHFLINSRPTTQWPARYVFRYECSNDTFYDHTY